MNKGNISYFSPPVSNTTPEIDPLSLEEVWEFVSGRRTLQVEKVTQAGRVNLGSLQSVTEKVRSLSPEVYSDKRRGKVQYLPMILPEGVFTRRGIEGLSSPSGFVLLDIDHISQLEGVSLEDLKERLSQDREIGLRLLFTSPSRDGLKIVCKTSGEITDSQSYRREFETLNYFVSQKYSIPIGDRGLDPNNSDISRGCLLCFDPGAILKDWEDTFQSDTHPLPEVEKPRPKPQTGPVGVFSWEWDSFTEERLIPAIFARVDQIFPDMDFRYNTQKERWESPLKRDGTHPKGPRSEKTFISQVKPWGVFEQGGNSINVVEYYRERNSLQYGEALRELSRLCGLEEEYLELSRRYAKEKNKEYDMDRKTGRGEALPQTDNRPQEDSEESFKDLLQIHSLRELASTKREGIKTPYQFKTPQGKEENLILPSGALTLVCGQSSHGKSRLLQNLALQIATGEKEGGGEGVVLYFSFEEGLLQVVERFANIQINLPRLSQYGTSNTEVIRDYFKSGELSKAPQEVRQEARPRLSSFEDLYTSGRLRIIYSPDLMSGRLCNLLGYLSSKWSIKAVFLDYVQAIYKEGNKKDRREELREICKEINKTAIDLQIPIVLSAQLNRDTPSPSEMSGSNIAESADITRYADTILLLWDSIKIRDLKDRDKYLSSQEYSRLQERGFTLGEPGKLYALIDKNRGGTPEIDSILSYVPETGKISDNEDLPSGEMTLIEKYKI